MKAEASVKKTISEHGLIKRGDRVVLGLSGGADSLCLLHVLCDLRKELGFELYALHLNHLMRGEAAEEDERFLKKHCDELCVGFKAVRKDVRAFAEESGLCEEEAGRKARHEALREWADELEAKVAFAHNRDDQAETVLLRIMRGTGIHGIAAMEYSRKDGVIRPLLDTPRSEIEDYCRRKGLEPRIDSTNFTEDYARNKLRRMVFPVLEEEFNPSIKETLSKVAANAREEDEFISEIAEKALDGLICKTTENSVSLSLKGLRELHPAIFKRVIRNAFCMVGLTQDIAQVHLNSLLKVVQSGVGGKTVEFPGNYIAKVGGGLVVLSPGT